MSEQNKTLVRRAREEVGNRGNFALVDELGAPDIVVHSPTPGQEIRGAEGLKQFYIMLRAAFPDIHFTIEDQIAEGDRVVTRWIAQATHTGEFQGLAPTGKLVKLAGIDVDRIVDGKVVECWPFTNDLDLLQQLGVDPTPGQNGQEPVSAAWDKIAPGYDEFVTSTHTWVGSEGLRRANLGASMRFLDVAAGSGALSIPAARLGAQVLAVDFSARMLERLNTRARKEGLANLETCLMDGHALELEDNSFDVSGSQFGVMLFPDLPRGLREMARVTRPGGRVLLIVFGPAPKVEFLTFFTRAIQAAVPGFTGLPTDPPPLPFQVADPNKLRRQLANAGLKDIQVETVTEQLEFDSGKQMWDWVTNSNPIGAMMVADLTGEQKATVQQTLDTMLRERSGGSGPAILTSPIHIGIGTK
jgi:steroid delta-isomerase-like uncharacterized protein